MMKTYKVDRKVYRAETPYNLIIKMMKDSFPACNGVDHYMQQVAERTKELYNIDIVYTTVDNFVEKLIEHGIIKIVTVH